jgi:hypothetical protein
MPKKSGNYYWIDERLKILREAVYESSSWGDVEHICRCRGIKSTLASMITIASRYKFEHPHIIRGGRK